MAEPYPVELRARVVDAYESGAGTYAMVGQRFDVGEATVKRWVAQFRREGHVQPRSKGSGPRSTISGTELEALVDRLGDATASEITAAYNKGRRGKHRVHASSIKRALHRAGFVVKKNGFGRPSSSAPTS